MSAPSYTLDKGGNKHESNTIYLEPADEGASIYAREEVGRIRLSHFFIRINQLRSCRYCNDWFVQWLAGFRHRNDFNHHLIWRGSNWMGDHVCLVHMDWQMAWRNRHVF